MLTETLICKILDIMCSDTVWHNFLSCKQRWMSCLLLVSHKLKMESKNRFVELDSLDFNITNLERKSHILYIQYLKVCVEMHPYM